MSDIKVRKPNFDFSIETPFQWQPDNPRLALSLNATSFFAVGFERFVVKTMRDVLPLITDPEILQEAKLFLAQEAQHGLAHKQHVDAMVRLYPGLGITLDKVCRQFDDLYNAKSIDFRLAYVANLESTFPPIMNFMIENRKILFSKGNRKLSCLFLWHAIEETEHRGSASIIYNHVVSNNFYRLLKFPHAMRHLRDFNALIRREFASLVSHNDRTANLAAAPAPFECIAFSRRIALALGLVRCVWPWHDAGNEKPPQWFEEWIGADRDGVDMTTYFGQ